MLSNRPRIGSPGRIDASNPVNAASPLNAGRVAWWLGLPNTVSGRHFFDVANGHHATANGTPYVGRVLQTDRGGTIGAVVLNGLQQCYTAPDSPSLRPAAFSIGGWSITSTPLVTGGNQTIIAKPAAPAVWTSPYVSWLLRYTYTTGQEIEFSTSNGGTYSSLTGPASIVSGWDHFIATYDGATKRIYRYGQLLTSTAATGAVTYSSDPVILGAGYGASPFGEGLPGALYDQSIWNRALTAGEVNELFWEGLNGFPATLNRLEPTRYFYAPGVASASVTFAATMAAQSLAAAVTAAAPPARTVAFAATAADHALAAAVTAAAAGSTLVAFAATAGAQSLAAAVTAAAPPARTVAFAATMAAQSLTSAVTAAAAGSTLVAFAATTGAQSLTSAVTTAAPPARTVAFAATLADHALAAAVTAAAAGSTLVTFAATTGAQSLTSAVTAAAAAGPAQTMAEALAAVLASDAVLAPLFPGGWWLEEAARDVDPASAYGVYQLMESAVTSFCKPGYSLESVPVHFWVLAPRAQDAERLAVKVRQRLAGTSLYTPPALSLADATESNRYWAAGGLLSIDPERAPLGADSFRRLVPIVFTLARGD